MFWDLWGSENPHKFHLENTTPVSYEFVRLALAFGKMLGIDIPSETFGIKK